MKYLKPEITSLASASSVIMTQTGKTAGSHDSAELQGYITNSAYESDE